MSQEVQQQVPPEVVVVTDVVPNSDKTTPPLVPEPEEEVTKPKNIVVEEYLEATEASKHGGSKEDEKRVVIHESSCFNEESNKVSDLSDYQKKALDELKQLVQEALNSHQFSSPTKTSEEVKSNGASLPAETTESHEVKAPEEEVKQEDDLAGEAKEKIETVEANEEQKTATVVDDDDAKTVEAIEETIVAVSSTASQEQNSTQSKESNTRVSTGDNAEEAKEAKLETTTTPPEEVLIWGVPVLADERMDVILLKFLRARDFKVKEAFTMLKNTIAWRKEFKMDELMEQDLACEDDLEKVVFMHGVDKEGHPVCYNVYGEFQNKELYQKTLSDEEKRQRFLRWRIQLLEKSIRKLDFRPGGVSTIVQVNDLKNSPGPAKRELRQVTKQALQLLQDNYPEFVARQVFINVPWWYLALNKMISPFLTQRTKSKFVVAGPSKSAETLLKFITAEQLPIKYGGLLSKDGEFDTADAVTDITVKPASKHTVEFPITEECVITWEVRVVGWDVSYGAEFVPSAEDNYTVIIQKSRKVAASQDQGVVSDSFKICEAGKVVITIDNPTSKKKKLLYRLKIKSSSD